MSPRRATFPPDLILLGATAGWGLTYPVVKIAFADASPGIFLVARFALGTLAALPLALRDGVDRPSLLRGALLGLFLWAGYALNTWGLLFTSATRAGFVTSLSVVLVPILGALFFHERAHVAAWFGAGLATLGLFIMNVRSLFAGGSIVGDLLVTASAFFLSFHILITGRFARSVRHGTALTAQVAVVALFSTFALPFEPLRFHLTSSLAAAIVFTGVCASALFIYAQLWAQARTSSVHAALIFSLEPLLAAFFSYFMVGDPLVPDTIAGGSLIFAGIVLVKVWPRVEARLAAAANRKPQP